MLQSQTRISCRLIYPSFLSATFQIRLHPNVNEVQGTLTWIIAKSLHHKSLFPHFETQTNSLISNKIRSRQIMRFMIMQSQADRCFAKIIKASDFIHAS